MTDEGTPPPKPDSSIRVETKGLDPGIWYPTDKDSDPVKLTKITTATNLYQLVIIFLGVIVILVVLASAYLLIKNPASSIPDGIIAIGSAAVGALAGLLAQPSPGK
jgi:hypothetical protein